MRAKKKNIKSHYRPVSYEEVNAAAKKVFVDSEKYWKSLHPTVQKAVLEYMNSDHWKDDVAYHEEQLKKAGLTKEEVEFKPKVYHVGGFEIRFDLPDSHK